MLSTLSVTDLELYMKCPRAFQLKVLAQRQNPRKNLAICRLNTIRRVTKWIHELEPGITLNRLTVETQVANIWANELSDPNIDSIEGENIVRKAKPATKTKPAQPAVTKAERQLSDIQEIAWHYFKLEQDAPIAFMNVAYEIEISGIYFTGKIDQIRYTKANGYEAIILLTNSQMPKTAYILRDFQLSMAALAVWQGEIYPDGNMQIKRLQTLPTVYAYYLPHLVRYKRNGDGFKKGELRGLPWLPANRTKLSLYEFVDEVHLLVSGIQHDYFPMNVTRPGGCELCPVQKYCCKAVGTPTESAKIAAITE